MKYFALLNEDGSIHEVFAPVMLDDGTEVPIADRLHPDLVARLVEYDPHNPPAAVPSAPTPIARSVTMRQARLALLAAGRLKAVEQAIAALPSPQKEAAQIEWEFAATVDRDSSFLQSLAALLNLDDAALDTLFAKAAAL